VLLPADTDQTTIEILYCGPPNSGKTANLKHMQSQLSPEKQFDYQDGVRSFTFVPPGLGLVDGKSVVMKLVVIADHEIGWDSDKVGQVLARVDGVVFVADSNPASEAANLEARYHLTRCMSGCGRNLAEMPFVLQYNKRDLPNGTPSSELNEKLNEWNSPSFEAVATEGFGVFATLKEISRLCITKLQNGQNGQNGSNK
jgi:hypothetical protein